MSAIGDFYKVPAKVKGINVDPTGFIGERVIGQWGSFFYRGMGAQFGKLKSSSAGYMAGQRS